MDDDCPCCSSVGEIMLGEVPVADHRLSHWPIQIKLIGSVAPFLNNADLMVAADCTAFAAPNFHNDYLKESKLLIGCPKLDNGQLYVDKFTEIFTNIPIKSLSTLIMEVPCCSGMTAIFKEALHRSGKDIPFTEIKLSVKGELLGEREISVE